MEKLRSIIREEIIRVFESFSDEVAKVNPVSDPSKPENARWLLKNGVVLGSNEESGETFHDEFSMKGVSGFHSNSKKSLYKNGAIRVWATNYDNTLTFHFLNSPSEEQIKSIEKMVESGNWIDQVQLIAEKGGSYTVGSGNESFERTLEPRTVPIALREIREFFEGKSNKVG